MIIDFYLMSEDRNKIGKTLNVLKTIKAESNVKDLSLIDTVLFLSTMTVEGVKNYNYLYIHELNRYYFIENVSVTITGLYKLQLHCDLLETYKNDILDSFALINQSGNNNKYYDGGYLSQSNYDVDIYKSNKVFNSAKTLVITTLGG